MSEIIGFALFFGAAFALAYAFLWVAGKFADRSPLIEAQPSRLDRMDGVYAAPVPRCWSTGPRGGHTYVRNCDREWTCMDCGDKREAS